MTKPRTADPMAWAEHNAQATAEMLALHHVAIQYFDEPCETQKMCPDCLADIPDAAERCESCAEDHALMSDIEANIRATWEVM